VTADYARVTWDDPIGCPGSMCGTERAKKATTSRRLGRRKPSSSPNKSADVPGALGQTGHGASDDDPSALRPTPDRAKFGFSMLWVALFTFPLMAAVQEICDRTALASGRTGRTDRRSIWTEVESPDFVLLGLLILATRSTSQRTWWRSVPVCTYCTRDRKSCGVGRRSSADRLVVSGSFELTARVLKIFAWPSWPTRRPISISVPWDRC